MSLMEFCEVREGRLVPTYEKLLEPILCDWCEGLDESLLDFGAMRVCPECFGKAETMWNQGKGNR